MEVCIDSVESAQNAEKGGAKRVELCANLLEGGTTPSVGMLKTIKSVTTIPVFVMIRPRGGDFLYSESEILVMKQDISCLKEAGADGFVFGILTESGDVDVKACQEFLQLTQPLPVTFHRAIDMTRDIFAALDSVISLQFDRVLTSGGHQTAQKGAKVIKEMISKAAGLTIIVPGGGISEDNLLEILETGVSEFHGSARHLVESKMTFRRDDISMGLQPNAEYSWKVTSTTIVRSLLKIANDFWQK